MYDYIKGTLTQNSPANITVETGGIGYKIHVPLNNYNNLPQIGDTAHLYLSFIVKEDSHTLFGFLQKSQRDIFEKIITVSGIGPKTGLLLIGYLEPAHFFSAIKNADIKLISKVPGIGKKTAERLIIEMKDKLKIFEKDPLLSSDLEKTPSHAADALNALIHLGYNHLDAQKAIKKVMEENSQEKNIGRIISMALKKM